MSILRVLEDRYLGQWKNFSDEGGSEFVDWIDPDGKPSIEELKKELIQIQNDIALQEVRDKRNELLSETDWVSGEDVPQSIKDTYFPYRQALRDITTHYSNLKEVVWPEKPNDSRIKIKGYYE